MKYLNRFIPLLFIVSILTFSCSISRRAGITEGELKSHIRYLSSDSLQGRKTGSTGDSLAAVYIEKELASYGLRPLFNDGFQRFKITDRIIPGKKNFFSIDGTDSISISDFSPLSFSGNSELKAEVVFAGYGFNVNNDSIKWKDYNSLDVKDKWVLILRGDPEPDKAVSGFVPLNNDRDKVLLAKDMGAAGVLMVSGPVNDPEDKFESFSSSDYPAGIPVLRIKRELADIILHKSDTKTADLEKSINTARKTAGFPTGITVYAGSEVQREKSPTRNVAMILPGEDKKLKNEYVIIGAHFDHLGKGGPGSSSRAVDTTAVHHGADDNASGVAEMLELAEKFSHTKGSHKRSILFLAFSGEESGLLGSKFFTENAGIKLSSVNAMINLDMVGRLQESKSIQISGVGTAAGLKDIVTSYNDTNLLRLNLSEEGFGPSDHSSFYGKNIPVLFYTTGAHPDYHTPADTWDKINYNGMVTISEHLFRITETLANSTDHLQFKEAGGPASPGQRTTGRKGVTLGIMPDFAGNYKNGLRADFVSPGKPAALGGMKKGDIIISIEGKRINNIQDYMYRMGQLKHGQTISVEILRDGKTLVLMILL